MSQYPPVPAPAGDVWSRFSADPRVRPDVRASDADRDVAAGAINAAFGDGRLDPVEHDERLAAALGARRLGQLVPLIEDITVPDGPAPRTPAQRSRLVRDGAVRAWIGMAVLFNVIWLATWLFSGDGPYYYWPVWPMIGTAIPALIAWATAGTSAGRRDQPRRLGRGDR